MRKRAGLARALALDPEILFLDEPTAGLDPIGAAAFDRLIGGLQRSLGLTVVMVTHDLDLLAAICDRVAALVDKRVVVGTLQELRNLDHPWLRAYFDGPRGRAALATVADAGSLDGDRASYVIVGAVVLALLAGLAAFSLWLVEAGVDRDLARYEIAFAGSVSGLQEGGQVLYRGIPVGRVGDIRIDPDNVETVLVAVEVDRETPIKADTVATLEFQGLTGIAYVQLRGGTQASAGSIRTRRRRRASASRRSALERVFESTPELLARTVAVVDRLGLLLTDENLEALAGTLRNVETVTAALADRSGEVDAVLAGAAGMTGEIQGTAVEVRQLATDLRQLTGRVDQQVEGVSTDLGDTLTELRGAASSLAGAARSARADARRARAAGRRLRRHRALRIHAADRGDAPARGGAQPHHQGVRARPRRLPDRPVQQGIPRRMILSRCLRAWGRGRLS